MEKGENDGFTNVVEKSVLYCESSPFANDLNGQFTSSSTLRVRDVVRSCGFNPITATSCKQYIFRPYTLYVFIKNLVTCQCEKKKEKKKRGVCRWGGGGGGGRRLKDFTVQSFIGNFQETSWQ